MSEYQRFWIFAMGMGTCLNGIHLLDDIGAGRALWAVLDAAGVCMCIWATKD